MDQTTGHDLKLSKILLVLFILLLIPLSVASWIAYAVLSTPELIPLDQCFIAKMNDVKVCPGTNNYTRLSQISENLKYAVIYSEDAGFWGHSGLDWHELEASLKANIKSGSYKRGGSTITQQLIKNIYFSGEKTLTRKIREVVLTRQIEEMYPKSVILEKYLNLVEFGPNIYGIGSASKHFFYKSPSELNILESAYLAFLLPNPKGYYEYFRKGKLSDFAKKMVLLISKRLYFYKKISSTQYAHAKANVDRFPWYGLVDWNYSEEGHSELENMDENTLEDEFDRIVEEDVPGEVSVDHSSAEPNNSGIEAEETKDNNDTNVYDEEL